MQNNQPLFGNNIPPACEYCTNCHTKIAGDTYFCEQKATDIEPYESCGEYVYDPLRRVPKRRMALPTFSVDDFKL